MKLYLSPFLLDHCEQVPLTLAPQGKDSMEFTEAIAKEFSYKKFYVELRSREEIEDEAMRTQARERLARIRKEKALIVDDYEPIRM